MALDIYGFSDYRPYLLKYFGDKSLRRGLKSKAAAFLGVHTTLISQILHDKVIPNLEQGDKLNQFIGHNEEESHYFLLLLQKARAGTRSLQNYFQSQLDQIQKNRQVLKKRVGNTETVALQDELRYYSAWQFSAVHVALSVPELSQPETLSAELKIPLVDVRAILDFLVRAGLAQANSQGFSIGTRHIHLGTSSTQLRNHHLNWRLRAMQAIDQDVKNNFHYSSVVSLSRKDVQTIKELLIQALNSANRTIQTSKEETVYGMNFDFFHLKT